MFRINILRAMCFNCLNDVQKRDEQTFHNFFKILVLMCETVNTKEYWLNFFAGNFELVVGH